MGNSSELGSACKGFHNFFQKLFAAALTKNFSDGLRLKKVADILPVHLLPAPYLLGQCQKSKHTAKRQATQSINNSKLKKHDNSL